MSNRHVRIARLAILKRLLTPPADVGLATRASHMLAAAILLDADSTFWTQRAIDHIFLEPTTQCAV